MFKQVIVLIVLSLLTILAMPYAKEGLEYVISAHDWVANSLNQVFSAGQTGNICREFLALLAIPVAVGLIPAAIYGMLKRRWFPYFMEFVWVAWLLQAGALIMVSKGAVI